MSLYVFINSLSSNKACAEYTNATRTLYVLYTYSTRTELGKITYSKIAHTLYVFLYSVTLLFSLLYKNRALGFPKSGGLHYAHKKQS